MKQLIILLIIASLGWYGYTKFQDSRKAQRVVEAEAQYSKSAAATSPKPHSSSIATFKCDGRTHCSQMTSCAEATFFLRNCPGTQMDGNNDGIPCERQWCK
ncbi:MAG: excalibur calcium-binding domain-containing protein [Accumulibacter sp.]|uniref:excalibur calcium-binding domain-containing protein n=1 Tax=Accumulibacter sp. TaxID=2053492 RepID=UPI002FC31DF7